MNCHCCSNRQFSECCEPIIQNRSAHNPEQLMRSRYSAYVVKNYAYILATYHPVQQRSLSLQALSESAQNTKWLRLEVLHASESDESEKTAACSARGTVEFIATYTVGADFFSMHELSHFIKQDDNWYYTTGVMQEKSGQITPNRNDLCPCGSSKKYKKCCLLKTD